MILAIDIGNSNIVLGLFEKGVLQKKWRLSSSDERTKDEYFLLVSLSLQSYGVHSKQIREIVLCSVSPPVAFLLSEAMCQLIGREIITLNNKIDLGIKILIDNPHELGMDRLVNAFSGYNTYQGALILIDFGTATTFDVVSQQGEYLGGVIAAGLQLSLDALNRKTAQLPRVDPHIPDSVIGTNTMTCMQSGLIYGHVAMTDGLVERICEEMHDRPKVIATGGLAYKMHKVSRVIETVDDDLTLRGIYLIYHKLYEG